MIKAAGIEGQSSCDDIIRRITRIARVTNRCRGCRSCQGRTGQQIATACHTYRAVGKALTFLHRIGCGIIVHAGSCGRDGGITKCTHRADRSIRIHHIPSNGDGCVIDTHHRGFQRPAARTGIGSGSILNRCCSCRQGALTGEADVARITTHRDGAAIQRHHIGSISSTGSAVTAHVVSRCRSHQRGAGRQLTAVTS